MYKAIDDVGSWMSPVRSREHRQRWLAVISTPPLVQHCATFVLHRMPVNDAATSDRSHHPAGRKRDDWPPGLDLGCIGKRPQTGGMLPGSFSNTLFPASCSPAQCVPAKCSHLAGMDPDIAWMMST